MEGGSTKGGGIGAFVIYTDHVAMIKKKWINIRCSEGGLGAHLHPLEVRGPSAEKNSTVSASPATNVDCASKGAFLSLPF